MQQQQQQQQQQHHIFYMLMIHIITNQLNSHLSNIMYIKFENRRPAVVSGVCLNVIDQLLLNIVLPFCFQTRRV